MTSARPEVHTALRFAVDAHARGLRKDGRTPYIVHPVGVMRLLVSDLGITDPVLACGALLHDVVEDCGVAPEELAGHFGAEVAHVVEELTIPPELHGPHVPEEAKTARLTADLGAMSWGAVLVKLCDRRDNLSDIANANWGSVKRQQYLAQSRALIETIRARVLRDPPAVAMRPALGHGLAGLARDIERAGAGTMPAGESERSG